MVHHVKRDTIVVMRVTYRDASELCNLVSLEELKWDPKITYLFSFPFAPHLFERGAITCIRC